MNVDEYAGNGNLVRTRGSKNMSRLKRITKRTFHVKK